MESDFTELFERIVDHAQQIGDPHALSVGTYAIVPTGCKVEDLSPLAEKYLPAPRRKKAAAIFYDAASFCDYWQKFTAPDSLLLANPDNVTFTAILDYHGGHDRAAGWREHTAKYELLRTVEWGTWESANGKRMTQEEFAKFIEDNTPDIFKPPAADMMEIARELNAKKDVTFTSGVRLKDGQNQLKYQEQTTATVGSSQMEVPELFTIRLEAYLGSGVVEVQARLRYRIEDGKLKLWYDLLRPHKVKQTAFNAAVATIAKACGQTVLLGSAA